MHRKLPLAIDITHCAEWPQEFPDRVEMAVTVCLPDTDHLSINPIVAFASPGGGYTRQYYDLDLSHLPGCKQGDYSQVNHHLARGLVVVTCDHLCVGESTVPPSMESVTVETLATANAAMVEQTVRGLENGTLIEDLAFSPSMVIGVGHSMGGAINVVTQSDYACFDAIAILGCGLWGGRARRPEGLEELFGEDDLPFVEAEPGSELLSMKEIYYQSDVPQAIIDEDTQGGYPLRRTAPAYGSLTLPPCVVDIVAPGVLVEKASNIRTPVFLGYGDRDILAEPEREPSAYENAHSVSVEEIASMGHMHNFASSRHELWDRVVNWARSLNSRG